MATGYAELANELVRAANGVDYAYRDTGGGESTVPLVLLRHFRGNLDNWDPALIDALASTRRVVTFDSAGVGGSTGTTPHTIEQMARDAIAFLAAMQFSQADLLGFSNGSFIAQQIALVRPAIVRRLVLASSAPQGAAGMHGLRALHGAVHRRALHGDVVGQVVQPRRVVVGAPGGGIAASQICHGVPPLERAAFRRTLRTAVVLVTG